MIEFPTGLADDLLSHARSYLKPSVAKEMVEKTRQVKAFYEKIFSIRASQVNLEHSSRSRTNPSDLGALCFHLNTLIPVLDLKRANIYRHRTTPSSFSIAQSVAIVTKSSPYLDVLSISLLPQCQEEDEGIFATLSRLVGVGHLIIRARQLGSSFFKAIRHIPIKHLEINDLFILESPDSDGKSFLPELAKYLASNPPLEKLTVSGQITRNDVDSRLPVAPIDYYGNGHGFSSNDHPMTTDEDSDPDGTEQLDSYYDEEQMYFEYYGEEMMYRGGMGNDWPSDDGSEAAERSESDSSILQLRDITQNVVVVPFTYESPLDRPRTHVNRPRTLVDQLIYDHAMKEDSRPNQEKFQEFLDACS